MDGLDQVRSGFLTKPPYLLVQWNDPLSDAVAFLAIESLRGNACGGGTRVKMYESLENAKADAVGLAKAMELKFLVTRLPAGGAKTVIAWPRAMGDPSNNDKERRGVLLRWFRAAAPLLQSCYGTGPDQNTSDSELSELLRGIGVSEPRYGLAKTLYGTDYEFRLERLARGINEVVRGVRFGDKICRIVDLATGFGVAESVAFAYTAQGQSLRGKRVTIEGFGAVGTATAYFIAQLGARIVGVSAIDGYTGKPRLAIASQGLPVEQLISHHGQFGSIQSVDATAAADLCDIEADVFVPAATTGTINAERLARLRRVGVTMIAPGANSPFSDASVEAEADQLMTVLPDFVVNCGMARTFAYFLQSEAPATQQQWPRLKSDLTSTIHTALAVVDDAIQANRGVLAASYAYWINKRPAESLAC